jgi:hypothetical protein
MYKRISAAMGAYAILAVMAFFALHGLILKGVLILLAGLAAKTLIAWKAGW